MRALHFGSSCGKTGRAFARTVATSTWMPVDIRDPNGAADGTTVWQEQGRIREGGGTALADLRILVS